MKSLYRLVDKRKGNARFQIAKSPCRLHVSISSSNSRRLSLYSNPPPTRYAMSRSVISSASLLDESMEALPHEHAKGQNRLYHRSGE